MSCPTSLFTRISAARQGYVRQQQCRAQPGRPKTPTAPWLKSRSYPPSRFKNFLIPFLIVFKFLWFQLSRSITHLLQLWWFLIPFSEIGMFIFIIFFIFRYVQVCNSFIYFYFQMYLNKCLFLFLFYTCVNIKQVFYFYYF